MHGAGRKQKSEAALYLYGRTVQVLPGIPGEWQAQVVVVQTVRGMAEFLPGEVW